MSAELSIIIANYNNEQYIAQCLDSVLGQTYSDYEIVIADDASNDSSPDIIKKYISRYPGRVHALYHEKNAGVSRTRHGAILASRGRYITTLDSDDYYHASDKLEKEMAVVGRHRAERGKQVCAFSNTILVRSDGTFLQETCTPDALREGMILEQILTRSCAIPRDFIMPRDAYFDAGGYDPDLNLFEDWDLKIRLAARYEFYYSGVTGTAYRRHDHGLSSASVEKRVEAMRVIFRKNLQHVDESARELVTARFEQYLEQISAVSQR